MTFQRVSAYCDLYSAPLFWRSSHVEWHMQTNNPRRLLGLERMAEAHTRAACAAAVAGKISASHCGCVCCHVCALET